MLVLLVWMLDKINPDKHEQLRRVTMSTDIFEKASKLKLRFQTNRGPVNVEDLWDMPLLDGKSFFSLDGLARRLDRQLKEAEEHSFVKPQSTENNQQALALDIVKRVIEVKLKNIETQEKKAATIARKGKIMEILASKEDDSLREKSADELMVLRDEALALMNADAG